MEERFTEAAKRVQSLRRTYSRILVESVNDSLETEDLIRLVGTLEAAYNHILAAKAKDFDLYCILKHLSYALILMGEIGYSVEEIYNIMSILTEGKIKPCSACENDKSLK